MSFWREEYHVDKLAYEEVVTGNCYRLGQFQPEDILIDIGGHIGAFCYAALDRGARRILTVEADGRNFAQLLKNIAVRDLKGASVETLNAACWRSDQPPKQISMARFNGSDRHANTGASTVVTNQIDMDNYHVQTVSLDALLDLIGNQRVRFLKMDCEGAEFAILYTSKKLHRIQEIAMELHPDYEFTLEARVPGFENSLAGMLNFLWKQGFQVESNSAVPHRPYVYARRL